MKKNKKVKHVCGYCLRVSKQDMVSPRSSRVCNKCGKGRLIPLHEDERRARRVFSSRFLSFVLSRKEGRRIH